MYIFRTDSANCEVHGSSSYSAAKQAVRVATQYAPAPLLSNRRAPLSRRNATVLSHAEYIPTLTAAAALRVKTALSKAAW